MEKVALYRSIAETVIRSTMSEDNKQDPVKEQLIIDERTGNYLLLMNGWQDESRFYGCLIHIEVKSNGKVWVHEDRTDLIVVDKLLEKGITKKDMVIGFHPPIMREDTEFAIA